MKGTNAKIFDAIRNTLAGMGCFMLGANITYIQIMKANGVNPYSINVTSRYELKESVIEPNYYASGRGTFQHNLVQHKNNQHEIDKSKILIEQNLQHIAKEKLPPIKINSTNILETPVYPLLTKEELNARQAISKNSLSPKTDIISASTNKIIESETTPQISTEKTTKVNSSSESLTGSDVLHHNENTNLNAKNEQKKPTLNKPTENEIYFANNSSYFDASFRKILNKHILYLNIEENRNMPIEIIGFADKTGDNGYNLHMSKKRAQRVADYLIENGINQQRLKIDKYGAITPELSDVTDTTLAFHRKVEINY